MLESLQRYGPGSWHSWSSGTLALGCNLSKSLPEDIYDLQPLWSEDRSTCVIADVRLDNRAGLARELGLTQPEHLPDSAFLLAAWLRWGHSCLDRLLGGFAFAVWTPARQEVFAARDPTGERPLFFHRSAEFFALASMPKALLALPGVPSGFQEAHLADWIAALKPSRTATFFAGIERLPAGHFLRVTPAQVECKQYWNPRDAKPVRYPRDEDYAEAMVEILDRATEARLRSTRRAGSFLSAGLDSSAVTASAAILLAKHGKTLTSFTAVPRPEFNGIVQSVHLPSEAEGAAEVARLYPNIEHVLVDTRGYDLLATLKRWTGALDEPFPNVINSLWITATLNQAKQRGIGVVLEGAVGNGTFSWHSRTILSHYFLGGRWLQLARTVRGLRGRGEFTLKAAARASTRNLLPMALTRLLAPRKNLEGLFDFLANPEWMRRFRLRDRMFDSIYDRPPDPRVEQADLFEEFDLGPIHAAAEAVTGVEMRDPFQDRRVYDFCFGIPQDQYVVEGHTRSLARRSMRGRLPQSTLDRYQRGQQGSDWYITESEALPELRAELALIQQSPAAREVLDIPAMQALLDNFPASGFHVPAIGLRWHYWLMRAISMGYFLRSHEPSSAAAEPVPPALETPLV